jgi:hypothetical protein
VKDFVEVFDCRCLRVSGTFFACFFNVVCYVVSIGKVCIKAVCNFFFFVSNFLILYFKWL